MQNLPFGRPGRFYKGNLHTHSTNSDGTHPPAAVVAAYKAKGYDFLALTDHFLPQYDWPVSDTRGLRDATFTTLISAELHAPRTSLGEVWHIKAVGLPLDFAPAGKTETGPEIARRAHAAGAFVGIVHPSWSGLTLEDARTIDCAHAIEIYNHGSEVEVGRGSDWPFCDSLLNDGWRLTGYATDDAHLVTHDAFGGWVQVRAEDRDPDAILAALKAGHFYSSQGPEIADIAVAGDQVTVASSPAATVQVVGRGSRALKQIGDRLTEARFSLKRFAGSYFRVTVVDAQGLKAWSNPVWLQ